MPMPKFGNLGKLNCM